MPTERRIQVCWEPKGDHKKSTYLHRCLFGHRIKRNRDFVCFDGLLSGFKDGKRVKLVDWERFGPRNLSVPADLEDQLVSLFDKLRVDHRIIQYDTRVNLFSKRYPSDVNWDSSCPGLEPEQAKLNDF
jgi:hypothetical protein